MVGGASGPSVVLAERTTEEREEQEYQEDWYFFIFELHFTNYIIDNQENTIIKYRFTLNLANKK